MRGYISKSSASFVVSSSSHSFERELLNKKTPFFNFFLVKKLGPISKKDAEKYLIERIKRVGMSYEEEVVGKIIKDSDCHPFYLQLIGLECFLTAKLDSKKIIDVDIYNEAFKKSVDRIPSHLVSEFMKLEGRTKDVFVGMCLFDLTQPSKIAEKIGMNASNVTQILRQIEERYGIVKRVGRGKYIVTDNFLKEWVRSEWENYMGK